jgi:hypothetical protein
MRFVGVWYLQCLYETRKSKYSVLGSMVQCYEIPPPMHCTATPALVRNAKVFVICWTLPSFGGIITLCGVGTFSVIAPQIPPITKR